MTVRRSKKVRKQRGSRVYGYGRISGGHRKSGSRGGVGNAGSKNHHKIGKITDMILSQKGFTSPNPTHSVFINVGEIDEHIEFLIGAEIAEKEGTKIKVDIKKKKQVKVIGKGLVTHPFNLHANLITEKKKKK
ncbi:MAG: 50S ribosomal protein L15, partial [Candidatus Hodarchaeales archaeon]